jgi:ATP-dependent DNA helicase 2 subunit 2
MAIEDTYSPVLHRINQAIRWRAAHPSEPIPPVAEILTKYSQPPAELLKASQAQLTRLIETADVKKGYFHVSPTSNTVRLIRNAVPPKAKGKRSRDAVAPLSGLDVDSLLSTQKRPKISSENAVPEFKQMLATTDDPNGISAAATQMSEIIYGLTRDSFGDANYDRVAECMRVMREELRLMEEPALYNDFLREFKGKVLGEDLGGDRREMWWKVRKTKLGLLDQKACEFSEVTEEEAEAFYAFR